MNMVRAWLFVFFGTLSLCSFIAFMAYRLDMYFYAQAFSALIAILFVYRWAVSRD